MKLTGLKVKDGINCGVWGMWGRTRGMNLRQDRGDGKEMSRFLLRNVLRFEEGNKS